MEIVSGGATPNAFSTSVRHIPGIHQHGTASAGWREHQRTAQAIEPELVDLIQGGRVLEIVLDDIDVVGGGQQTRELGRL